MPEVVEELGPGVRVLHDVQQLQLVVLQDPYHRGIRFLVSSGEWETFIFGKVD